MFLKILSKNIINFYFCIAIINQIIVIKETNGFEKKFINMKSFLNFPNNNNNTNKNNNNDNSYNQYKENNANKTVIETSAHKIKYNINNYMSYKNHCNERKNIFLYFLNENHEIKELRSKNKKILSRHRRYVAFPEGSSFSVAVCATVGIVGNIDPAYMAYGLNWGVSYDLPNHTWTIQHLHGFKNSPVSLLKRRSRRSLFNALEISIENMGYNGRDCILRALCESPKFLTRGKNMIEEILRTIFSFPKSKVYSHEHTDIMEYDEAYRKSNITYDCSTYYNCGFSLLDLVMGRYSDPPTGLKFN